MLHPMVAISRPLPPFSLAKDFHSFISNSRMQLSAIPKSCSEKTVLTVSEAENVFGEICHNLLCDFGADCVL